MNMRKKIIPFLAVLLIGMASCDKFLDINTDPSDLTPGEGSVEDAMLPALEMQWVYIGNGTGTYGPLCYNLQMGITGTWGNIERLIYGADDGAYLWSYYTGGLRNANYLYKEALKNGKKYYMGISQIIMAWHYSEIVDRLDKIPIKQAFMYPEILNPVFDEGQVVYDEIFKMLDDAVVNLSADGQSLYAKADIIFGGDVSKWIKTAKTLKARYAMRLSYAPGKTKAGQADIALAALTGGLQSADDEPKIAFQDASNAWSWFYQATFINPWRPSIFMMNLMQGFNDPRIPVYFEPASDGVFRTDKFCTTGQADGSLSRIHPNYVAPATSMYVSTLPEARFLEAEAYVFKGNYSQAENAFKSGVTASLEANGITGAAVTTYLAQFKPFPSNEEAAQKLIITQKYLAMFIRTTEPWLDYLRTGYPELDWAGSIDGLVNNHPPYRHMYPTEVRTDDPNCPAAVVDPGKDKIFWDKK